MNTIEASTDYKVVWANEASAVIQRKGERFPWMMVKLRKHATCVYCRTPIVRGEVAFKPGGSPRFRNERLHTECVRYDMEKVLT
jgi:hypothetical protein